MRFEIKRLEAYSEAEMKESTEENMLHALASGSQIIRIKAFMTAQCVGTIARASGVVVHRFLKRLSCDVPAIVQATGKQQIKKLSGWWLIDSKSASYSISQ